MTYVFRRVLIACMVLFLVIPLHASAASRSDEVRELLVPSEILQRGMPARIYLPPGYDPKRRYPVLYLFHGQLENQAMWEELGLFGEASALIRERKIRPLIIVTPFIDNSFGVNSNSELTNTDPRGFVVRYPQGRFEDYIVTELIPYIERNFAAEAKRSGRWVGGISMGGFAALHTAFRHPEMFNRVGGHSPAFPPPQWDWLFPDFDTTRDRHPSVLAETRDLQGMKVYLDCGQQDDYGFQTPTEKMAQALKAKAVDVTLALRPGRHNRGYWSDQLGDYLLFYAGQPARK